MIKFLDLSAQYQSIKSEVDQAMRAVISDAAFIGGHYVKQFEKEFANYLDVKHCVGVGNGTDALEIAIEALNLPSGSEIIVPANSFIASSEAVTRQGHKVVFADTDPESYVLSIDDVKHRISSKTKAIMAVHLYGHPCDMDELLALAKDYGLKIIEDCAQAHGAEYKGKKVGGIGDVATFSFYPGKNLGAYGDGGAITTNDDNLAKKCQMIANHGRIAKYDHEFEGRNSRLDGLQAAILSVKLKHLNAWTEQRIKIADHYIDLLKDERNITLPVRKSWAKQVYHLFVIRVEKREELKAYLVQHGVQTGIHYPKALPDLNSYSGHEQAHEGMLVKEYADQILSLPIGEHVQKQDVVNITNLIIQYFAN